MRGVIIGMATFAVLLPILTSAQTPSCVSISRNLSFGSRRSEVVTLQQFLISQNLLATGNNTGYFGRLTETAIKKLQCAKNIICSGSPSATGYGAVGPKTRAIIRTACSVPQTTPSPRRCMNPPQPNLQCDGQWKKLFNKNRCLVGWTCVATQSVVSETNKAPFISAIIGPTLLKPNVSGTWKVIARDPENDTLVYSVIWGDEGTHDTQLLAIAQEGTPYSAATTTSHTYKNAGSYTMVVFAKDTGGNIVQATLSINVYKTLPPPITIGVRVQATANLEVRSKASLSGSILGQRPRGARGTATGGPVTADGDIWWNIIWDSGPDGWSVQDYIKKATATSDANAADATAVTALQLASEALKKANTALIDANNSVIVANSLRILPGTLPAAVPALNSLIATAKRSAASAVKNGQKALSIAQTAYNEAMSAVQLGSHGQTNAASAVTKKSLSLARQSFPFSTVAERFVDNVNLIKRLLSSAVLWPGLNF